MAGDRPDPAVAAAEAITRELAGRPPEHDFTPTLERAQRAAAYLGDPQGAYRVVHIAGSNGKTSTARLVAALVAAHGLRVGLLTSPPYTQALDRIEIDGETITPAAFVEAWASVKPVIDLVDAESATADGPPVSIFEAYTLLGLTAFADAPVDVAVVEVGLGGTWDATNIVTSDVQAITPVARDHEDWLGADLAGIAAAKAGILGARAVIGHQGETARRVIAEAAAERDSQIWWAGEDFRVVARELGVGGQMLTLEGIEGDYPEVWLPLHGTHQADNAALALAAVELLLGRPGLDLGVVRDGFAAATSPGRLEAVRSSPLVLVDAAHNQAGAEALAAAVGEAFPQPMIGLVGVLAGKDAEGILGALEPLLDMVVVTESLSPRALATDDLARIAVEVFGPDRVEAVDRLDDALARAIEIADTDSGDAPAPLATAVLATGSVTIAAQVSTLLAPNRGR